MSAYYENMVSSPLVGPLPNASVQSPPSTSPRKSKPRPVEELFPSKLYQMLEEVDALGLSAAVSWRPHGRAFIIKDKALFMAEVIPRFFKATKLRSFQRQCHLWGFKRIPTGRDAGSWWHESFVLGRPQDLKHIARTRVKGLASSMAHVPDFYEGNVVDVEPRPAPLVDMSAIVEARPPFLLLGRAGAPPGPFVDLTSGDLSSVSSPNSRSEGGDEDSGDFDDDDLRGLFAMITPVCVASGSEAPFGPKMPDLNTSHGGGKKEGPPAFSLKKKTRAWSESPVRRSTASPPQPMGVHSHADVDAFRSRSLTMGCDQGLFHPDVNFDRDIEKEEDVPVDEFSEFIERMIQMT